MRMKPSNVRKKVKKPSNVRKKVKKPPNVRKKLSHVTLELRNVRMKLSSVRKK